MSVPPPVIFLMGPTASGKTDLAVALVDCLPCDIISVDSALVYRGMDIGTAKPAPEILQRAPHRLIDIRDPGEAYSAAQFREEALREIEAIHAAGRIPLLTGGTMLYFRALQQGLSDLPAADPVLRARLDAEAMALGKEAMHQRLAAVDPVAAARIHPNDPQRVQRALEVFLLTGASLTRHCESDTAAALPYRIIKLVIAPQDRAVLHARIEARFLAMLEAGFVAEVRKLRDRPGMHAGLSSMRAVGYRQIWEYLDGRTSYEEMVKKCVYASRQLAKRQLTWLRAERDARWFESTSAGLEAEVLAHVRQALASG